MLYISDFMAVSELKHFKVVSLAFDCLLSHAVSGEIFLFS